jgi:hypothetical protein
VLQAQQVYRRCGNIGQAEFSVFQGICLRLLIVIKDQRHFVQRMAGLGFKPAALVLFGLAVFIRSNISSAFPWSAVIMAIPPSSSITGQQSFQAQIHGLNGDSGCQEIAGMPNHVAVGKLTRAKRYLPVRNSAIILSVNLCRLHPWSLLKRDDVGWNFNISFQRVIEFSAAVSIPEVGYMAVFLISEIAIFRLRRFLSGIHPSYCGFQAVPQGICRVYADLRRIRAYRHKPPSGAFSCRTCRNSFLQRHG